jgi:hypothetical protein
MAPITGSYVTRTGAENARIVRCGSYAWVRLNADTEATDLLFRFKSSLEGCTPAGRPDFNEMLAHAS